MRLICSVSSVKWAAVSQGSSAAASRKARSTISVFKKGEDSFLMWCTAKNKHGTKYKLRGNIEKCFTRMVDDGKATLRLVEPRIDLHISEANVTDLKRLLNAIKMACKGESLLGKGILSSSGPVQNKVIKKPQTKMKITCKRMYPLTQGFPSSLEHLTTENCDLIKVDSRMLKLRHLTHLCLNDNKITSLPDAISDMQSLVELEMESNLLTELPKTFCETSSKLCKSLRSLKLNDNQIKYLPDNFGNLQELYQIRFDRNQLKFLPHSIGKLVKLKTFCAAENRIRVVPFSIKQLKLDSLDLSQNDFMDVGSSSIVNRLARFRSLQELTASFVLLKGVRHDSESLTRPCHQFLEQGKKCLFCEAYVFRQYVRLALSLDLYRIAGTVTHIDSRWRKCAPVDVVICSERCFRRFRFNDSIKLDLPEAGNSP